MGIQINMADSRRGPGRVQLLRKYLETKIFKKYISRLPSEEALTGHTNGTPGFEEGSKRAQLFNTETRKVVHDNSLGGAVSAVVLGRNTLYTHAALFSKV